MLCLRCGEERLGTEEKKSWVEGRTTGEKVRKNKAGGNSRDFQGFKSLVPDWRDGRDGYL